MKNKDFGKPLSRLITMVAICMLSLNTMAYDFSYTYQGKTLCYDITSSNTVCVTYYSSDNYFQNNNYVSGDVVIPSSVSNNDETYSVTSIGEYAFRDCSSLTSVTIPNSVTSIGWGAFESCSSLTSVTIPNSVTSIGEVAFYECSSLTSVTIPNSVTSIGDWAFKDCSSLITLNFNAANCGDFTNNSYHPFLDCPISTINIGDSVQRIPAKFARDISSLTSVTIPNSVTSIGEEAFYRCSSLITLNFNAVNCGDFPNEWRDHPFRDCPISTINIGDSVQRIPANFSSRLSSLTAVTIGNSVTSIGENAFYECSSLTSITIPNSVTSIGESAFYECSSLTSVTIGNSLTSIDNYTFRGCSSLTSVTIPNSVTSIGEGAFYDCSSLTSLTIPNSVTSIGEEAFRNCSSLITLNFNAVNCGDFPNRTPFDSCPISTINIGNSVQRIPANFASGLSSLTSVTIPNSVTSIGENAFENCSSLTSVTIGNSVTSIGNNAFQNCSSLTSVTIGNSVTSIDNYTFRGCSSLTSITIPNSVTSIGNSAFYDCSSLTSVTIPNSVTSIDNYTFRGCSSLTSVTIPNSVTSIGNSAFYNCSNLTTLNFNAINCGDFDWWDNPFYGCPISTINIGDSVQRIPANFAYDNDNLTSITIPNSVTSIGDNAFYECSSLTSITIPNSVTSIGSWAFNNCRSLTTINFDAVNCEDFPPYYPECPFDSCPIATINIGDSVQRIPAYFAKDISSLTSITIPESVTSIGDFAFMWCSSLTSVAIPNSVTSIGEGVFSYCSSLTSVTIGSGLTSIGNRAFYGCGGLTSIVSNAVVPPAIGGIETFTYPNICSVTVPCGSLGAYTAPVCYWSVFFPNRITEEGDVFDVSVAANDDSFGSVSVETQSCSVKVITATPSNCKSFAAWNDGNTDNPRTITVTSDTSFTAIFEIVELSHNITAAICEGTAYTENGFNVSEAGVYTQNLQTINGCDSTVTLTLTVNPVATTNLTAAICEGTAYTENGFNVSEAGVYTQNLQTINGCDSTVTLTLTVNPVATTTLQAAICEGSTYTENGFNVSEAGVYTQNLQTVNGCDSTVTLTLTVNPVATTTLQAAICEGTIYTENGFNVSEAGVYTQNLQTINGCDSTVTLTLSVNPVEITNLTAAICEGTVYAENGFNVSEAGVYTQNLQTINGCDSTVTLTLTVNPIATTTLQAAICEGTVYTENGFNVSEAGVYTQNLQTINGCDSTVTLTLTVNPVATTNLTATICEGTVYTENGFNVSEAGVYTQNLQTVNDCDSTVTLTLTVNPVATTNLTAAICEGTTYTENGFNVSEAGVYTQNLQTVNGCDSTVTLTLTVNPVATTNLTAAICEGTTYTENGFNVSEAGVYTQNLQNVNGCDSTVTLTLTVNPVATTTLQAVICEGTVYSENGFNVSEAGVYTQNLQTVNGCDSTVTLTLTVNPVATTTLQAAICEGSTYTENGFNVSETGVYTQNLQTINGCDSTVTLTLTVNPIATTNLTAAICEGTVYTENGFNVSEAGVYTQNLQTINGCDSTVTLTLVVNPVATTTLQAAICEGSTYTENGFNVSEAGVYTQNLQTINGCDSTVTLTLTVNPVATTTLQAAICEGSTYTENGFNVSEAGVYTQNLQTVNGCDSIVTLTLTVNPVATTNLTAAICEGTAYTENGFNVSEAGVYTQNLQTINGCDSTVTLTLTVNPVYNITIDATINQGDVYQENGFNVSEAGVYTQNLQSVNGCDSVIVLNLTVNSSLGDVVANTIEVALYPNPAESYTVLKVQGLKEQTKVALFDLRGRKLREFELSAGTESIRLDLRDLPSGVYTLMIGNTTKKLIVE
ncbi:MAG: leucine-rich repeat protein [Candidatus Onthomorpha sp.]